MMNNARSLFLLGLMIRLAFIVVATPYLWKIWYTPFLQHVVAHPSIDPWGSYMQQGGSIDSYPFGLVMLLLQLPGALVDMFLNQSAAIHDSQWGFALTILGCELLFLAILQRLSFTSPGAILTYYWLSPLPIYCLYFHGSIDIIPVTLSLIAFMQLKANRAALSGILFAIAVAAKLSMALPIPIIIIFLYRNTKYITLLIPFLLGFAISITLLLLPCLWLSGFQEAVMGTPQLLKIFNVVLTLHPGLYVYILPVLYGISLYAVWRMGRIHFELLTVVLAVVYVILILLTSANPGWLLWGLPFILLYLQAHPKARLWYTGFTILAVMLGVMQATGAYIHIPMVTTLDFTMPLDTKFFFLTPKLVSLLFSAFFVMGTIFCWRMVRDGIRKDFYFQFTREPYLIGIAGDSSSGKDTLTRLLVQLFGMHSTLHIQGDNYHLWDRHNPMWATLTHLHPQANDLPRLTRDVVSLLRGQWVKISHYNHSNGRYEKPVELRPKNFMIVNSLHALYPEALRGLYDLKIFLDMDETLRRYLKIHRDVTERGKTLDKILASLDQRAPDAERFIQPQKQEADIIFRLYPVTSIEEDTSLANVCKKLGLKVVCSSHGYITEFVRLLVGLHGAVVTAEILENHHTILTIVGDINAAAIQTMAERLMPQASSLMALQPQWENGALGIMQLITVMQIVNKMEQQRWRISYV